jgi:hypothetical protein
MSKYASPSAVALVDGYDFLAPKVQTLGLKNESMTEQSDGLGDAAEAATPVGKSKVTLTQGGAFWDTASGSMHDAMSSGMPTTPQSASRLALIGVMGQSVGAMVYGLAGVFTCAYETLLTIGKLTKANLLYSVAGALERGQIVQPLATKTVDWNTKTLGTTVDYATDVSQPTIDIVSASKANPCVVSTGATRKHGLTTGQVVVVSSNTLAGPAINGERIVTVIDEYQFSVPIDTSGSSGAGTGGSFVLGSTASGGAGYQMVTALSGFTGFVGKLRHSVDDTTYSDLATFANVTAAPAKERVAVVGTINRYLCFDGNVTGVGSIRACAALMRS